MAGSVNKAFILGRLGADPEVRFTASGQAVANFNIATDEYAGKGKESRTEWHRIVAWGKTAEICKEYLHKGSQVHVEGRLQTRDWQDRDGGKRYTTEVVADRVTLLGRGGRGEERAQAEVVGPPAVEYGDDVPF